MSSLRRIAVTTVLCLGAVACETASDIEPVEIDALGTIVGQLLLDADGSGDAGAADEPLEDVGVQLFASAGQVVIDEVTTDTLGVFRVLDLPAGSYRVEVDASVLGDSLVVGEGAGVPVGVERGDTARVTVSLGYPSLSVEEVLAAEPGRRVVTSGVTLNSRPAFSDGLVHLQAAGLFLRMTQVGRGEIGTGDSIRVVGRTAIDNGSPILEEVSPFLLVRTAVIPTPVNVESAEAADAREGELDAALVRLNNVDILDTTSVGGDFVATVDDGSGPVDVVLRSFLQTNNEAIRPDTVVRMSRATGLLVPLSEEGAVRWRVLPRSSADVALETRFADLGVTQAAEPGSGNPGDTILLRIVASNAGPLDAGPLEVTDTIPDAFTILEIDATRGVYDPAAGAWELESLEVGASDTLRLTLRANSAGFIANTVRIGGLEREVDPNSSNNTQQIVISITNTAGQARRRER